MPIRGHKILAIIWLIFLIRGAFYCRLIPLWEGFDEWSHYAFLEQLRLHPFVLPRITDPITEEIRRSVQTQPIRHEAADPMLLYEAKQPPLYYWILSIPNGILHALPIEDRVFWLRVLSVLIASLAIPFGYFIALELFGSRKLALTVCALIASMPGLMIDIARIGNDALSVAIASWIIWLLLGKKSPWLGLAFGAGLLTKAFFLAFVPLLILRRRFYSLAAAVAISGWWYWRTIRLTGTITGETMDAAASKLGWSAKFVAMFHDNWLRTLDSMVWTHIWTGAWSFFTVRSWMYRIFEAFFAAAALAIVVALLRRPWGQFKRKLALICSMEVLFAIGILYQALSIFIAKNVYFAPGWYFYLLVDAEAVLLTAGMLVLAGRKRVFIAMAFLVALYVALDLYSSIFVLARKY